MNKNGNKHEKKKTKQERRTEGKKENQKKGQKDSGEFKAIVPLCSLLRAAKPLLAGKLKISNSNMLNSQWSIDNVFFKSM